MDNRSQHLPPSCLHSLSNSLIHDLGLSVRLSYVSSFAFSVICLSCCHSAEASNNIVPLGVDKCGCCDKKLGEGKMQSVSISSHCQSTSASNGGDQHLTYWCVELRAASADYAQPNLQTVMPFHLLPSFTVEGEGFVGRVKVDITHNFII